MGLTWSIILNVLAGLTAAGGAIVELVARRFSAKPRGEWISLKNDLILATDIAWGFGIILLALSDLQYFSRSLYYWFAVMLLVSHLYRVWESKKISKNAFCADISMERFNLVKLAVVAAAMLFSIVLIF